ncbi:DUF3630 family protein [Vibrio sp. 99-8-1]|uniref:DUF3630 family protein n=1 Tax=Vibrio sp. 99-8-1 TaxID=2607602 RepID=UPI0014937394|nr:DUF3630 family protein [Vibrio sp. 99-8-1]NOI68187.1 DUF3630 family protein [Vibrio sp. 99-8-1]
MANSVVWQLKEHIADGKLILSGPSFDVDSFPAIGNELVRTLSATIVEKQFDADLHSWLIDFEGCRFFLRAEHYTESIWLEAVSINESEEELNYLAKLFSAGI